MARASELRRIKKIQTLTKIDKSEAVIRPKQSKEGLQSLGAIL